MLLIETPYQLAHFILMVLTSRPRRMRRAQRLVQHVRLHDGTVGTITSLERATVFGIELVRVHLSCGDPRMLPISPQSYLSITRVGYDGDADCAQHTFLYRGDELLLYL